MAVQNAKYKTSIQNVISELDLILRTQQEIADTKWAAEERAKALE